MATSQLWQRLRAARKFADLTQAQLAAVCNVTRSGYAFFESSDDNARTRPNTDQIMAIAKLTKVPIDWLLNDASEPGDVWKIGVFAGSAPKPVATAGHAGTTPCLVRKPDRREETFWRAVEYSVSMQDPHRAEAFDVLLPTDGIGMRARYQHERVLACFCTPSDEDTLTFYMGRLFLYERSLQRSMSKHLLVWTRGEQGLDLATYIEVAQKLFGVTVKEVQTAEEAAAYLLSQK